MSRFDDLLTDADLRTSRAPLKEPARKWRNKWRVGAAPARDVHSDTVHPPNTEYWGTRVFPSHETAEAAAMRWVEENARFAPRNRPKWLGAFAVEEPK